MCISHFLIPFDNLLIYGQCLLLLEHTQYHLQIPNELDSVVIPMCCMLRQGKTKLTEELTLEGHGSSYLFNITWPLSLDWLLHCFCVKAFTFCFPDYYRTFSAILILLIIKHLPPFYTPKSSPTSLCVAQTLWYFYSAIYITCFDCNFPLSNCIKFWDLVSGWLVSGLLEL